MVEVIKLKNIIIFYRVTVFFFLRRFFLFLFINIKDIFLQFKSEDQVDFLRFVRKLQEDFNVRISNVNGLNVNFVKLVDSNGVNNFVKIINFVFKNQIVNIYMGRLRLDVLQKYQKNMDMLYKNFVRGDEVEKVQQEKLENDKNRV